MDAPPKVVGPWPDPPIPDFDGNDLMVPPWIKYPNLPRGSMGWRMGLGESYLEQFDAWYNRQHRDTHKSVWSEYPEPSDWQGFYRRSKMG